MQNQFARIYNLKIFYRYSTHQNLQKTPPPPTDWRRHFFNWTGAGVLGTSVQKIFRYHWHRIGATTTDAALSAPLVVKLNMRYEIVSHNKFSIGKFFIGVGQKQKSSYREIPYAKILCQKIPYMGDVAPLLKLD